MNGNKDSFVKKPNNIIRIPAKNGEFFRLWLQFLLPFHNLTNKEMDVATAFLKERFELSKVVKDNKILDKVLLGDEYKKKIRDECGLKVPHFQVILSKLRKEKFVVDDRINPKFIPNINIEEDPESFKLLLYFDLK